MKKGWKSAMIALVATALPLLSAHFLLAGEHAAGKGQAKHTPEEVRTLEGYVEQQYYG